MCEPWRDARREPSADAVRDRLLCVSGVAHERQAAELEAECMYHVTLRMAPDSEVSLRVANQDLARTLALAARLEFLNPGLKVTYRAEPHVVKEDAA